MSEWPTFYHYTCDHGRKGIGDYGVIHPTGALFSVMSTAGLTDDERLMRSLLWATDLPEPDIEGLGLTSEILSCERWTHRYRITNPMPLMRFTDMQYRFSLEAQKGLLEGPVKPEHWFASWKPLPAIYDPVEVLA